jgi:hypothetical protein
MISQIRCILDMFFSEISLNKYLSIFRTQKIYITEGQITTQKMAPDLKKSL